MVQSCLRTTLQDLKSAKHIEHTSIFVWLERMQEVLLGDCITSLTEKERIRSSCTDEDVITHELVSIMSPQLIASGYLQTDTHRKHTDYTMNTRLYGLQAANNSLIKSN